MATEIDFQLDYHLGSQFAGLIVAQRNGLYAKRGLEVNLLAPPPPGQEPELVYAASEQREDGVIALGCIEQNTFVPSVLAQGLPIKAISAMLHSTPLALASRKIGTGMAPTTMADYAGKTIAGATDTEALIRAAVGADCTVLPVPREDKWGLLMDGKLDAVQVYTTTELLQLQHHLGEDLDVVPFGEGHGYCQVIFAATSVLEDAMSRVAIKAFLEATYEGWMVALANPTGAGEAVAHARQAAGMHGGSAAVGEGVWSDTAESQEQCLRALAPLVSAVSPLGVIDPKRFMDSADNIAADLQLQVQSPPKLSDLLDLSLFSPSPLLPLAQGGLTVDGVPLADRKLAEVLVRSCRFWNEHGRRPKLVSVEIPTEEDGSFQDPARVAWSPNTNCMRTSGWLDKEGSGDRVGVEVERVVLPIDVTTEEVVRVIHRLNRDSSVDGILVEVPLPLNLPRGELMAAVDPTKDVDGMSSSGMAKTIWAADHGDSGEYYTEAAPVRPVTPGAVLDLLDHSSVVVDGMHAVVVGNSSVVGQPLALMLQEKGATVTVCHEATTEEMLEEMCQSADLIVACAGVPGLITADIVSPGAVVINVGTRFIDGRLVGDVSPDVANVARITSLCPGGVGPIPFGVLMENVLARAEQQQSQAAAVRKASTTANPVPLVDGTGWSLEGTKGFELQSYAAGALFVKDVARVAEELGHHPKLTLGPLPNKPSQEPGFADPPCYHDGCRVLVELGTLSEEGAVTGKDIALALRIDELA